MALITIERIIPAPVQSSILLQEVLAYLHLFGLSLILIMYFKFKEEEKLPNNGLSNTDNM